MQENIIRSTQAWIEEFIIAENLCPFAHKEFARNTIRYEVLESSDDHVIYDHIVSEFALLKNQPEIQTTLIIWPRITEFESFLSLVGMAEMIIQSHGWATDFQLAHFHPGYVFTGASDEDAENYTNRAPYPTLHILRTAEMTKALSRYPQPEKIPENNITRMNEIGTAALARRLAEWQKL